MKTCMKCGVIKAETEYGKNKRRKDGLYPWCKECVKAHNEQHYQGHKEQIKIYRRKYSQEHKEQIGMQRLRYYQEYGCTWRGFTTHRWNSINQRTINGSHPRWDDRCHRSYLERGIRLEMTREEFKAFCLANKDLIEGMYKEGKVPSLDRIDGDGHYSINNIQIISMSDNCRKSAIETHKKKAIIKSGDVQAKLSMQK